MGQVAPQLETLLLSNCMNVSVEAARALEMSMPALKRLEIHGLQQERMVSRPPSGSLPFDPDPLPLKRTRSWSRSDPALTNFLKAEWLFLDQVCISIYGKNKLQIFRLVLVMRILSPERNRILVPPGQGSSRLNGT